MRFFLSEKRYKVLSNEEVNLQEKLVFAQQAKLVVELEQAQKQIARLEKQLELVERKYEDALERADRQLDGILAQQGLPDVTATVRREKRKHEDEQDQESKKKELEIAEIFAESIGEMEEYDGLTLPGELQAEAAKLIAGKKNG